MLGQEANDDDAPARRLVELPPEVRKFLSDLRPEEVSMLRQGVKIASAIITVGYVTRWIIIVMLGILAGTVMFGESIQKIAAWFK